MEKFGLIGKILAGAGQGLSMAGEIGYRGKVAADLETQKAEILAQRDRVMQRYEDRRLDKQIVSHEKISGADIQARRDLKLTERDWHLEDAETERLAKSGELDTRYDLDIRKLDYEHKLKKEFEEFKAEHGTKSTSTLIDNVNFLVRAEIANTPREAFEMLRTSVEKPEHQAILDLAGALRSGFGYSGKDGVDRSMQDATRMVRSLKGGASAASPGGAKKNYTVGGKTFTDADIESTARKYGITTEEVKRRLGIK